MRFLDPEAEGEFRALQQSFHGLPLWEITNAIAEGRVIDARTGEPYAWRPRPMVLAVTDRLRERIEGEDSERQVADAAARHAFRLGSAFTPLPLGEGQG